MIPASGAGGPGSNSRNSPILFIFYSLFCQRQTREHERQQREERVKRHVCARGASSKLVHFLLEELDLLLHRLQLGQSLGMRGISAFGCTRISVRSWCGGLFL